MAKFKSHVEHAGRALLAEVCVHVGELLAAGRQQAPQLLVGVHLALGLLLQVQVAERQRVEPGAPRALLVHPGPVHVRVPGRAQAAVVQQPVEEYVEREEDGVVGGRALRK